MLAFLIRQSARMPGPAGFGHLSALVLWACLVLVFTASPLSLARADFARVNLELEISAASLEYGQVLPINCHLWLEKDGQKSRVGSGRLVVSLISLETKAVLATFIDIPDGKTDVFSLSWRANVPGRVKVAAIFQAKGHGLIRRSKTITVISGTKAAAPVIEPGEQPAVKTSEPSREQPDSGYYLEVILSQTELDIGQVLPIDLKLWRKAVIGRSRAKGGRLVVSLYSLDTKSVLATFTDVPDGKTDVFGLNWRANRAGRVKISALYQRSGRNVATSSRIIFIRSDQTVQPVEPGLKADHPVDNTAGRAESLGPGRPKLKPLEPKPRQTGKLHTKVTIRALPDEGSGPPATAASRQKSSTKTETGASAGGRIKTGVRLDAQATTKPGQWRLIVHVMNQAGETVGDGEILIIAEGGSLKPGQGGQALLTAAAGRQAVLWTQPPGQAQTTIEASYFGGQGVEGEYAPSSATIELP